MRLSFIAALAATAFASSSLANPPPGIFSATNPTVSRYPVTLVSGLAEVDNYCGKDADPLSLVDATGKLVEAPFKVPAFSKFVLTDVEWSVNNGPHDSAALVTMELLANFPGAAHEKHLRFNADRVSSDFASGSRAFSEGSVFVNNTIICANARATTKDGDFLLESPIVEAYGYLVDDSAIPQP